MPDGSGLGGVSWNRLTVLTRVAVTDEAARAGVTRLTTRREVETTRTPQSGGNRTGPDPRLQLSDLPSTSTSLRSRMQSAYGTQLPRDATSFGWRYALYSTETTRARSEAAASRGTAGTSKELTEVAVRDLGYVFYGVPRMSAHPA